MFAFKTSLRMKSVLFPSVLTCIRMKSTKPLKQAIRLGQNLNLRWQDDSTNVYPTVWLRDNCQCPKCFHPVTKSRLFFLKNLNVNITADKAYVDEGKLFVSWSDGHESKYDPEWLLARCFTPENVKAHQQFVNGKDRVLWGSKHDLGKVTYSFSDIMNNDKTLLSMVQDLRIWGTTLVSGMEPDSLINLMNKVGFPRATHYGEDFRVEAKSDPNNLAYTTNSLDLHADLPFYHYNPGVQFLHCVKQCSIGGGENEFVDGFKIAEVIRENYPKEWKILTETKIGFCDVGADVFGEFNKTSLLPTIQLDTEGQISRINFNNQVRDSHLPIPPDEVLGVYKAMKLFHDLSHEPDHVITYKLNQGECVIFDNQRLLHGRKGFTMNKGDSRFLHGGYVDWDEIKSTSRLLTEKLQST